MARGVVSAALADDPENGQILDIEWANSFGSYQIAITEEEILLWNGQEIIWRK